MAGEPEAHETRRRIRTAMAWAGLDRVELAEAAGLSPARVARLVSPEQPYRARETELDAIAEATGVPLWFMRHGWTQAPGDLGERVELIEYLLGLREELPAGPAPPDAYAQRLRAAATMRRATAR